MNSKSQSNKQPKIALIHDELTKWGGGEYVLKVLSEKFRNADVYTSVVYKDFTDKLFPGLDIKPSFIQKLPFKKALHDEYITLYPLAFKLFNLGKNQYDVIISISSGFSKCISVPKGVKHIIYCLTPPRFLWMPTSRSKALSKKLTYILYDKLFRNILDGIFRRVDKRAVEKADETVSISNEVANRVRNFYKVESKVIYPPVAIDEIKFEKNNDREDYFLYLGRVESYKGVDLAIQACANTGKKLVVAGIGDDLERLKNIVDKNGWSKLIKFYGFVTKSRKYSLYRKARALIYPVRDEDFGIVPIEANASGCPVIAYRGGGVVETLSEANPRTAIFFDKFESKSLERILKQFDKYNINSANCRKQAELFGRKIFEYKIEQLVNNVSSH